MSATWGSAERMVSRIDWSMDWVVVLVMGDGREERRVMQGSTRYHRVRYGGRWVEF